MPVLVDRCFADDPPYFVAVFYSLCIEKSHHYQANLYIGMLLLNYIK